MRNIQGEEFWALDSFTVAALNLGKRILLLGL